MDAKKSKSLFPAVEKVEYSSFPDWKSIVASGSQFFDTEFPPDDSSLVMSDKYSRLTAEKRDEWTSYQWRRINDDEHVRAQSDVTAFIDPSDLVQGSIGDCYFISALSALAERPYRIANLFLTKEPNAAGIYAVRLWQQGRMQEVVIDDHFPESPRGYPFAKSGSGMIWPMILEKAWAKINGSYDNIQNGNAGEAFRALTGAPIKLLNHKDNDKERLWRQILDSRAKEQPICAAVINPKTRGPVEKTLDNGLIQDHGYSVLEAKAVKVAGKVVRLLSIRNPQGFKSWNGKWSSRDSAWTAGLRKLMNYTEEDRGVFCMSYDDFYKNFYSTTICEISDQFLHHSEPLTFGTTHNCSLAQLIVTSESNMDLTISQTRRRLLPNATNYSPAWLRMMVLRQEEKNGSLTFIEGKSFPDDDLTLSFAALQPGTYLVFVEATWSLKGLNKGWINVYSDQEVVLSSRSMEDPFEILTPGLKSCARQRTQVSDYSAIKAPEVKKYHSKSTDSKFDYAYIFYHNTSSSKTFEEKVDFPELKNTELILFKEVITLKPGEEDIIIMKRAKPVGWSWRYACKPKIILSESAPGALGRGSRGRGRGVAKRGAVTSSSRGGFNMMQKSKNTMMGQMDMYAGLDDKKDSGDDEDDDEEAPKEESKSSFSTGRDVFRGATGTTGASFAGRGRTVGGSRATTTTTRGRVARAGGVMGRR